LFGHLGEHLSLRLATRGVKQPCKTFPAPKILYANCCLKADRVAASLVGPQIFIQTLNKIVEAMRADPPDWGAYASGPMPRLPT